MALVFRLEEIPLDSLHYEITPRLVSHLTWAHHEAGAVSRRRFSHYGYKRLETDAQRRRIGYGVMRAGQYDVEFEEVARVLAGDILPRPSIGGSPSPIPTHTSCRRWTPSSSTS